MGEGWEWDETLFAGTAEYYGRGRLPYAPGLADVLAEVLKTDGRGRLIDVGCGPGTVALRLVHLFGEVVGVDPDEGMITEARCAAAAAGAEGKTRWVRARAEELPAGLGTFTVVAFAQSFHWMERDLVAATVRDMLGPGGALVHISDLKPDLKPDTEPGSEPGTGTDAEAQAGTERRAVGGLPHPPVPYTAMEELIRHYLGPVRRAGRGVLPQGTPGGEAEVFARAGFSGPARHVIPGGQALERTSDDVVAGVFSMSYAAPHLFGPHVDAFEADLRSLLRWTSPSGRFSERPPATEVFVWRTPGAGSPHA
ncbi:class I SAM-dependent methyltransferase [Streptomyces monticola]|uniref:Class I SAM-dependent methyltransferase n=1 Tax=Streptomyces monticola TaxID=2666263 RepID=A0ABW2JE28_9ACTN